MRKLFLNIHLWLSIPVGIIITVICLSGAALVYQNEINEILYPHRYFVENSEGKKILPLKNLVEKTNERLIDSKVSSVQIPSDPTKNYMLGITGQGRAFVYVNPYTGELTYKSEKGKGFFSIMIQLHRWLLDNSRQIGKPIVGYSTLLLVIILITGMIVWWPKSKKQLKHRLQIKTKYGLRRFWWDLHISAGAYVFIGLLVLALTGLTYSFRWYEQGLYSMLGIEMSPNDQDGGMKEGKNQPGKPGEKPNGREDWHHGPHRMGPPPGDRFEGRHQGPDGEKPFADGDRPHAMDERRPRPDKDWAKERDSHSAIDTSKIKSEKLNKAMYAYKSGNKNISELGDQEDQNLDPTNWEKVLTTLKGKYPNFKTITLENGNASVASNDMFGNNRAEDRYSFDPKTGNITDISLYKDQPTSDKVRGWIFSLHTGTWGGWLSKLLTFLVALIGASLPITGYYMFIVKRWKKNHKVEGDE